METTIQVQEEQVTGRPGNTTKLIREVRAKTRQQFSAEEKIRVVLEGFREERLHGFGPDGHPGPVAAFSIGLRKGGIPNA